MGVRNRPGSHVWKVLTDYVYAYSILGPPCWASSKIFAYWTLVAVRTGYPHDKVSVMYIHVSHRAGSYTSMSKGKTMVGNSTSHTPCMAGRGRHDELLDGWGQKRTTSAKCQTIRIVESSDMDGWKAVPRPMCKI